MSAGTGVPVQEVRWQMQVAESHHHPYSGPAFTDADAKRWYVLGLIDLADLERAIDIAIERGWA